MKDPAGSEFKVIDEDRDIHTYIFYKGDGNYGAKIGSKRCSGVDLDEALSFVDYGLVDIGATQDYDAIRVHLYSEVQPQGQGQGQARSTGLPRVLIKWSVQVCFNMSEIREYVKSVCLAELTFPGKPIF